MEARQLELFLAVLDSPTLTKAAERCHLSPATVSVQLHALADELNVELFARSGKRLIPTQAARQLEQHARKVLDQMRLIREEFENAAIKDSRPFHFATGATTLIYRLGEPIRILRQLYPKLDLHVTVLATEEIVAGILDRQFDLGLISLPFSHPGLHIVPLFEEELLLLRPAADLRDRQHVVAVDARELEGTPFLLFPKQSNMRTIIDRFFMDIGVEPRVVMEAADTEVMRSLVESGFGYSILPEYALRHRRGFFETLRVANHRLVRKQALAMLHGSHRRALTEAIADVLRQALDSDVSRPVTSSAAGASH